MNANSPKFIVLITAMATAFINFLILLLLLPYLEADGSKVLLLFVFLLLSFLIIFFVFSKVLETFIYRKIKLIYKTIHVLKTPNSEKQIDFGADVLSQVRKEVLIWAKHNKEEIAELKKLENYRREFLGNVSHELKTPIFSIQGYVHTLLDGALFDEKVNKKYLQKAANNVERLSSIVDDLESITKLEAGKLELEMEHFDIRPLVLEVFEASEMNANAKNIQLLIKEAANKSFWVYADRERIRQVLTNLVVNSIKYGRDGGRTLVGVYDMDEHLLVEISDNGIGIKKEDLSRVFERFFRVDKSRSRKEGGTGLGLAIVKHIIEAHRQTINVRSKENVGTTFAFTLKKGTP